MPNDAPTNSPERRPRGRTFCGKRDGEGDRRTSRTAYLTTTFPLPMRRLVSTRAAAIIRIAVRCASPLIPHDRRTGRIDRAVCQQQRLPARQSAPDADDVARLVVTDGCEPLERPRRSGQMLSGAIRRVRAMYSWRSVHAHSDARVECCR